MRLKDPLKSNCDKVSPNSQRRAALYAVASNDLILGAVVKRSLTWLFIDYR